MKKKKLDQVLGLNRSARLNGDNGLWTSRHCEMKNTEGKGENYLWKTNILLEEKKKGDGKGVKYYGKVKYFLGGEGKGEK